MGPPRAVGAQNAPCRRRAPKRIPAGASRHHNCAHAVERYNTPPSEGRSGAEVGLVSARVEIDAQGAEHEGWRRSPHQARRRLDGLAACRSRAVLGARVARRRAAPASVLRGAMVEQERSVAAWAAVRPSAARAVRAVRGADNGCSLRRTGFVWTGRERGAGAPSSGQGASAARAHRRAGRQPPARTGGAVAAHGGTGRRTKRGGPQFSCHTVGIAPL